MSTELILLYNIFKWNIWINSAMSSIVDLMALYVLVLF